jgi:hypothetical protein
VAESQKVGLVVSQSAERQTHSILNATTYAKDLLVDDESFGGGMTCLLVSKNTINNADV